MERAPVKRDGVMTNKRLTVHLGAALRTARSRASWTQADVAERVGVSTEVYGRMERGNLTPSVPNLRTLCLVLRLDADEALALESRGPAAWLMESPDPAEDESPPMRRLMRILRQLDARQLAAVGRVARTLTPPMEKEPKEPKESEEEKAPPLSAAPPRPGRRPRRAVPRSGRC